MSKFSKSLITIIVILIIVIGGGYYLLTPNESITSNNENKIITIEEILKGSFINKVEINNNPLRLKGKISISQQEFKDIVYTIANKNNIYELEKANIFINDNKLELIYPYKILGFIDTQIKVYLNPKVVNNNLELTLSNAKLGKINISDKLVVNNIKSYKDKIPFDIKDNVVIVSKDYTYPITLNNVEINNKEIFINLEIYANNLIDFITKYGINVNQ